MDMHYKYMVAIECMTYNHATYIEETLNGFAMQQTGFPVVFIIVDDASTDDEPIKLREWAMANLVIEEDGIAQHVEMAYGELIFARYKKNINTYYAILLLSENHHQTGKDLNKLSYIAEWKNNAKYYAICEGDDYWIDSLKLQKQVSFMESNSGCSLCFHAHKNLYSDGRLKECRPEPYKEKYYPEDIILADGSFMATNSILCRFDFLKDEGIPDFWLHSLIGDLPLMLYYITKGYFEFIDEPMSVYRVMAKGSWSEKNSKADLPQLFKRFRHNIRMYKEYNIYTRGKFKTLVNQKVQRNKLMFYKKIAKALLYSIFN